MRFWSLIVGLVLALASDASAQYQTRTWAKWRTIEAGHFAVHFPQELETWARIVAGKTAAIDSAVTRVVGYVPPQRIDIVIDDPFRIANGSSWPLLDAPRIVMWATPPSPREDIGTFVSWADMLTTHEFAHLAHLLRPSRNEFQTWLWKIAPVELGPLSVKAPRWVIEGYATYIEGVVTGSGRPNGVWRPTILRQWALEGVLPRYDQLNATSGMYGGEFAYLAGSSFLEWLAQRRGDSSLVQLWRRMSARRDRGFVESFAGVYGEAPDVLYGRFSAELTAAANQRESELRGDSGMMIQHLARETGDPAISRDGGRAAIMLASSTRPGRVVIWRTIPEPDSAADRATRALLERDPQDVAPYRPFPPPKRALATLQAVGNQAYQDPRFFTDGRVLVWRNTAIGNGSWVPDLYVWDPQRGSVRRITRWANVQDGDPSPDGSTVAGTQCGSGKCDLVLVDVKTGKVTIAASGADTRSFYRPRYSPDGKSIAISIHDGYWRAGMYDVATKSVRILSDGDRNFFDVSFADDSTLLASSDENGLLNIVRLTTDGRVLGRVTAVTGAAVGPQVNPADGSVWFLSLHARGWDVRSTRAAPMPLTAQSPAPTPRLLPAATVSRTKRYSPDRKWIYFPGGSLVRDGAGIMLGLANTDPVGKTEILIQGQKSLSPESFNAPLEGGTLSLTRRSRLNTTLSAFSLRQDGPFEDALRGGALNFEYAVRREKSSIRWDAGGSWSKATEPDDVARWQHYTEMAMSFSRFRNGRRTTLQLYDHSSTGRRGRADISRFIFGGGISSTEIPLTFTAQFGTTGRSAPEPFVIGGSPPSLAPPGLLSQYIPQPALSPLFAGSEFQTLRLAIPFGGLRLYDWLGRAYTGSAPRFEQVVGAEWSASINAIPVLGTPAARILIGAGRWVNRRDVLRQGPSSAAVYVTPSGKTQFYITTQFGDWAR